MPAKKIVVKKKKKKVTLSARNVQVVKDESPEPHPSQTVHMDASEEEALDNSASTVVELNSSTLKDPVKQIPLEPEKAEPSPKSDSIQELPEETFKFHCYRCGQKLKVPLSWANMSTTCGRCRHDVVVPPPLFGADD